MEIDNHLVLQNELKWLQTVINQVIANYLLHEGHERHWSEITPPDLSNNKSPFAVIVNDWKLGVFDRIALGLAMAPHLRPEILDIFFGRNQLYDRQFTEFGGIIDNGHTGFLPTGQTLLFLVTAVNPEYRSAVLDLLGRESKLIVEEVIILNETETHIPNCNGILGFSNRWMQFFLTGEMPKLEHSASFPAQKITTNMEWEDIVLDSNVMSQIEEINSWLYHGNTLMEDWGLKKILKPGYRALFYGPPGTGKTLAVTLLGKTTGRDVYKIDLSMIVSKYIGETEKNLARIFDIAQHKNWILFFDEADALFGKRTAANSSNDRHANQQTAYLLQRIEDFPGTVILASNLKANMDDAFTRRFQAMIHFKMPTAKERYEIWQNAFSGTCTLHSDIDLWRIAEDYEIAGGAIINVLRYCALSAIKRGDSVVIKRELMNGLKKEYKKDNKTLSTVK